MLGGNRFIDIFVSWKATIWTSFGGDLKAFLDTIKTFYTTNKCIQMFQVVKKDESSEKQTLNRIEGLCYLKKCN